VPIEINCQKLLEEIAVENF